MKLRIAINKNKVLSQYRGDIENNISYTTKGSPEDFHKFMMDFLAYQADLIVKRIKYVIKNQIYSWHPLSPSWKRFKELNGLSPKIWLASGQVEESITYFYNAMADSYFVGVHPSKRHKGYGKTHKSGVRIIDVIRWMECGTPKMKARPLFGKVMMEFSSPRRQKQLYDDFIKQKKGILL